MRVAAGAIAPGRPARDLRVSPGHALCLDLIGEVLVPAAALVNGTTIVQEDVEHVTYWHVELDSHDVILAENMPAESYLDMGNRGFFADTGVVAIAAAPDADAGGRTHADFCRPFHAGGCVVDAARLQLQRRATALGWRLQHPEPWADVALLVDGQALKPKTRGLDACFALPAGASEVWLVSATAVPSLLGLGADDRTLGLFLAALEVGDGLGAPRQVPLGDPRLCVGFHADEGGRRWTAGRARLPAELFADLQPGTAVLRLALAMPPLPRWVAPEAAAHLPALAA